MLIMLAYVHRLADSISSVSSYTRSRGGRYCFVVVSDLKPDCGWSARGEETSV